ncbi:MAG: DUF1684 domain-containing protein [Bacteroidales bacterium]|nr:DUF1684 domain-containing protein [Bacteroidales bacterium]MDD4087043.1 DUF1684 domain-containing protein [Bacteroidales bacterium]
MPFKLLRPKTVLLPTLWGWLILILIFLIACWLLLKGTYPFLSKEKAGQSKVLVVEGWLPDNGLKEAMAHYYENNYKAFIITGIPITQWSYSSPFSNMADASAGSLREMHFADSIYTVHIPNTILRDRTYATALALQMRWDEFNLGEENFDLFTMGAHARRSYLMFEKVFEDRIQGLVVVEDDSFDAGRWYSTSRGFRTVFSELISYFYARVFFRAEPQKIKQEIKYGLYLDQIQDERFKKDRYFKDQETTPLAKETISAFKGLAYFETDTNFRKQARFTKQIAASTFTMPTTTDRLPVYRKYGLIHFTHKDTIHALTAYQNMDILEKDSTYKGLFIPFKDFTNGVTTYGGGRYLDIEIPESDSIQLDFNKAYNPYCAYDYRWSCPIPPDENHLRTSILAGEKKFD